MDELTEMILLLGFVLLVGLVAELVGRRTSLPRVTLLIIAGVLFGPSMMGWLEPAGTQWFTVVSQVALTMVGFLLGGHLTGRNLKRHGGDVLGLSFAVVSLTAALVFVTAWLLSGDLGLALLLGGLATATAPAATADVVRESAAEGPFTETLLGVVAVDDAWGVLIFSLLMAAVAILDGGDGMTALGHGAWEIGGALVLGVVLGVPAAFATGRVSIGDPTLAEALGLVFLCLGAARWLEVSFLLAAVGMALVAAQRFPERAEVLLSVVLASTVVFEIVGPPMTRLALQRAGDSARIFSKRSHR